MDKLAELNAQLLDANIERKAKNAEHCVNLNALEKHLTEVLNKNIDTSVATASCGVDSGLIKVGQHTIDVYIELPWHDEKKSGRTLKINFCRFGSFSHEDADCVKYCETLGHVAGIMDVLEHQMLKSETARRLWDAYDMTRYELYTVRNKVDSINCLIKEIETALKKESILKQIVIGARVVVKKATQWRPAVIKTIEKIMNKNIIFIEDYGRRTNKDVLISNLMNSFWELAA